MTRKFRTMWLALTIFPATCVLLFAAEPTVEELLKPTRLTLITAGSDLGEVFAKIEKQTGNRLIDETKRSSSSGEVSWNFSLSDREFWPLVDKFLDTAQLEPIETAQSDGLPIGRRFDGMTPRFGKAIYVGPFRLEVTSVNSHRHTRISGDHRASVTLQVMWEPRLRPLVFSQPLKNLAMVSDQETPVPLTEDAGELSVETTAESHAVDLHIPLQLPEKQLAAIASLKGRLSALVATKTKEFRFDKLDQAKQVEQSEGGVKVVLEQIRENQGLCELHMSMEFDESLPELAAQGSWNFQNETYLENAAGERLDHAGFESTVQSHRKLGLAYYFDVPKERIAEYTWVYRAPAGLVEVPIEFEIRDIKLP